MLKRSGQWSLTNPEVRWKGLGWRSSLKLPPFLFPGEEDLEDPLCSQEVDEGELPSYLGRSILMTLPKKSSKWQWQWPPVDEQKTYISVILHQ